jgi:hypothetical protein
LSEKDERDIEFYKKVADKKQEIRLKTDSIRTEIGILRFYRVMASMGRVIREEGEKTLKEKVLDAVWLLPLTARTVLIQVYPQLDLTSREGELKLKSIRMLLLRLSGEKRRTPHKGKRRSRKGKLVYRVETKDGLKHACTMDGLRLRRYLQRERIKTENYKALSNQMRSILNLVEEYFSDVKQMIAFNIEDAKRLKYSVSNFLYQASSARVEDLALELIEVQKEVIESPNDSRVDTFLGTINKLLDVGTGEISDSENVAVTREAVKLVDGLYARLIQIEEENMAESDRRLKEFEESMTKKMEGSLRKAILQRV